MPLKYPRAENMTLIIIMLILLLFALIPNASFAQTNSDQLSRCQSPLYCEGPLLEAVQLNRIYPSSKAYVDMATKESSDEVIVKWQKMYNDADEEIPTASVKSFVKSNFQKDSEGLVKWQPDDFKAEPWFLDHIGDKDIRQFAKYCVSLFSSLGKKVANEEVENHSSLLYVPNGFIATSGESKELFYWNSYWVVEGLLICEMDATAKGIIEDFVHLIENYGFVPAGNRVYYTTRSQPPLLSFMVWQYLLKTRDYNWLSSIVKHIDRELQWWVEHRLDTVDVDGIKFMMARYSSEGNGPRPEMYYEDYKYALKEENNETTREDIFHEIKAAAESGWEISSRWMSDEDDNGENDNDKDNNDKDNNDKDNNDKDDNDKEDNDESSSIRTSQISPVDLNSFLYGAFMRLSSMYLILEDFEKRSYWFKFARELKKTIQLIHWDETDGIWYDFDVKRRSPLKRYSSSNFAPLWVDAYNDTLCLRGNQGFRAASYFVRLGLNKYKGGVPVTLDETEEKWDYPNAFPQTQSMIVQGFKRCGHAAAEVLAEEIAKRWIETNVVSWKKERVIFDYYNAESPKERVKGQKSGAGCASGVLLDFIYTYYVVANRNSTLMVVA